MDWTQDPRGDWHVMRHGKHYRWHYLDGLKLRVSTGQGMRWEPVPGGGSCQLYSTDEAEAVIARYEAAQVTA